MSDEIRTVAKVPDWVVTEDPSILYRMYDSMCNRWAEEVERRSAAETALESQSALLKKALGFGPARKETRDGMTVNVSDDAEYNLLGALEDLTNSNGNDEVTRRTIKCVANQIAKARAVLLELETK